MIERLSDYSIGMVRTKADLEELQECGREFEHEIEPVILKSCLFLTVRRSGVLIGWIAGYKNALWYPSINPGRVTPAITYKFMEIFISWAKVKAAIEDDPIVGAVVVPDEMKFTPAMMARVGLFLHGSTENIYYLSENSK